MIYLAMRSKNTKKGFTLIEVVVTMAIFGIMMVALSGIFVSLFSAYKDSKALTRDIETAEHALNIMGKELRTSTIVCANGSTCPVTAPQNATDVIFFDQSQSRCLRYRIAGNALVKGVSGVTTLASCTSGTTFSSEELTTGSVTGNFYLVSSGSGASSQVGRFTATLEISRNATSTMKERVQTSVSLRDYSRSILP